MPRIIFYPLLVFIFNILAVPAGHTTTVDTFLHIPRERMIPAAGAYYNDSLYKLDSAGVFRILDRMAVIARERKAPKLETYILLLKGRFCFDRRYDWKDSLPMRYFNRVLAAKACPESVATEALFFKGIWYYAHTGNYPLAFEYMLKAQHEAEKTGYRDIPAAGNLLFHLAIGHLQFKEPRIAVRYLQQAIGLPGNNGSDIVSLYNTLGMAYASLQEYDSAILYYRKAQDYAHKLDPTWIAIITGNIGCIYYYNNMYDTAALLLYEDYTSSLQTKNYESAANAAVILCRIYLVQGNIPAAEQMLDACRQFFPKYTASRWRADYYRCLSSYYKYKKYYERALQYTDSSSLYMKQYSTEIQKETLEQARNKMETEAHLANIRLLEIEKSQQILVRNTIIVVFILIFIIAIQILRKVHFRRKKEREILEIEKQRGEEDLQNAQNLLDSYTENLKQKQQLVDRFSREIEQLQEQATGGPTSAMAEKEEILKRLQAATILTEDDWTGFKKLFTRVHGDFFIRLNEKFPNLTQAEIRLISLSKLGLSVNEKANMLGISPDSVRRTKQRLVKKTGLREYEITNDNGEDVPDLDDEVNDHIIN